MVKGKTLIYLILILIFSNSFTLYLENYYYNLQLAIKAKEYAIEIKKLEAQINKLQNKFN